MFELCNILIKINSFTKFNPLQNKLIDLSLNLIKLDSQNVPAEKDDEHFEF